MKAVIFDLDGVLVDSEPVQLEAEMKVLGQLGIKPTSQEKAANMGRTITDWAKYYVIKYSLSLFPTELIQRREKILFASLNKKLRPMRGAERSLQLTSDLGYKMALASSNYRKYIDRVMNLFGWSKYFQVIVGEEDVKQGKPAPDLFLEAAKRLGVLPSQCVVFEDSVNGRKAAQAAGMKCVMLGEQIKSLVEVNKDFLDRLSEASQEREE